MLSQQMAGADAWSRLNPFDAFGMSAAVPASARTDTTPGIARTAVYGSGIDNETRLWHPDSPLFWVGAFLAVTAGLIATSTSIRVGPFRASASAGKA